MELPFEKTVCRHWNQTLYTLVNQEESQELKLPESMPDVGRIIASWGQPVLRGKEWRETGAGFSGGVLVWTLYAPEGGGPLQTVESWIPFQSRVDFPSRQEEGVLRTECVLRSIDTRTVSGRKLIFRAGIGLLVQALVPGKAEIPAPAELPPDVEQLTEKYPMQLIREAGEKNFLMEEELSMPTGSAEPEKLIYYRMEPVILDQRVMGSKAAFRGSGNLHVLYMDEEGMLCSADFEVPFAQYSELEEEYGDDATVTTICSLSSLEVEILPEGGILLKAAAAAQYAVEDLMTVEVLADAYSPCRQVELQTEEVRLPSWVDSRQELVAMSQSFPAEDGVVMDQLFLPELPAVHRRGSETEVSCGGNFQLVLRDRDGAYQGKTVHDSQNTAWKTECATIPFAVPAVQASCRREGPNWRVDTQVVLDLKSLCETPIRAVSAMEAGDTQAPDPERPSVIIRRMGDRESLWELARECGSTVGAIEKMNHLEGMPGEDRLLLIPVV